MKNKKIFLGILALIVVVISIVVGWHLKEYSNNKDINKAQIKGIEFSKLITENKNSDARNMLIEALKEEKSQEIFDSELGQIREFSLKPALIEVYRSGDSYIVNQEFIEEITQEKMILTIEVDKIDDDFVITAYVLK